jgi:hypothetical protein
MFCKACGQPTDSAFCHRCGAQILTTGTVAGDAGLAAGSAVRQVVRSGGKVLLGILALIGVLVWLTLANSGNHEQPKPQDQATATPENTSTVAAPDPNNPVAAPQRGDDAETSPGRPSTPVPRFHVFRSKVDEGTSVVVSPNATDNQLKSLLWLFREKVRSHHFDDIGITHPTSKQWGKEGYSSGIIYVYRGKTCAGENFYDYAGPCVAPGTDGHDVAEYQWGLLVDGVFNSDADNGAIYVRDKSSEKRTLTIFSYKDHWQLPAPQQAEVDAEENAEKEQSQLSRKVFADELQRRLRASGFDITVSARDGEHDGESELVLDSDMFKDTATRVMFLADVLPKWRRDVCSAGFSRVRLINGRLFSMGNVYSVGC